MWKLVQLQVKPIIVSFFSPREINGNLITDWCWTKAWRNVGVLALNNSPLLWIISVAPIILTWCQNRGFLSLRFIFSLQGIHLFNKHSPGLCFVPGTQREKSLLLKLTVCQQIFFQLHPVNESRSWKQPCLLKIHEREI